MCKCDTQMCILCQNEQLKVRNLFPKFEFISGLQKGREADFVSKQLRSASPASES